MSPLYRTSQLILVLVASLALGAAVSLAQDLNGSSSLLQGLVAWYPLVPPITAGSRVYDAVGRNHGTVSNGTAWTWAPQGRFPAALSFDGVDDLVDIPDAPALDFGTGDFSVCLTLLVRPLSGSDQEYAVIHKTNAFEGSPGWGLVVSTYTGGSSTSFHLVGSITTNAVFPANATPDAALLAVNTPYHVCLSRAGTTLIVYVDGQIYASQTDASIAASVDNALSVQLGVSRGTFAGLNPSIVIANVMLYARAFSLVTIAPLVQMRAPDYGGMLLVEDTALAQAIAIKKRILMQP